MAFDLPNTHRLAYRFATIRNDSLPMRKTKLSAPRRIKIGEKPFWQVTVPAPEGGRIRKTFKDREEARLYHERAKVQLAQFGAAAMIDDRTRTDAARAAEVLAGTGKTLLDAARFLYDHLRRTEGGKPLGEAVADFLQAKKAERLSDRYLASLRHDLGCFTVEMPDTATTANVTTADIDRFLTKLDLSPGTANTFRRDIRTFFEWASARGLSPGNPATKATIFKNPPGKIGILTPEDAAILLRACHPSILPGVVIGMFCGLRQAEITRLDWRAVDLAAGIVTVGAEIAKTSSRRTVEIASNALAWMAPYARESGPVWPASDEARNFWNLARIEAGFGPFFSSRAAVNQAQAGRDDLSPWPPNALRHSAISYRLALSRDLARLAVESGNSPGVIQKHYLELVKPEAARRFFGILPSEAANVIRLSA
jgi:site-specific recombinase XerD